MVMPNMYNSHNLAIAIKQRASDKKIALKQMLVDCQLGSNTMSALYHGKSIAFDSLARIADYLDCSVDYLLGRIDNPEIQKNAVANEGDSDIKVLYNKIICLDQDDRQTVDGLVDTLLSKDKYKKINSNVG